jgi:Holliday junction resolvase RusA-like endonuclease
MKIIIDGIPSAQTRMKYSARNGIGRIYDPKQKEKLQLRKVIANEFGDSVPFSHPSISFIFHMPIPLSIQKKLRIIYSSGFVKHEKKPDVDNFIKLYLDCLDGICFFGDQKVSLGNCVKLYHSKPKTIIFLKESSELLSLDEMPAEFQHFLFSQECETQSFFENVSLPDLDIPSESKT